MSFLNFVELGRSASGKTRIVQVKDRPGGLLGSISWHAPWRRYCFESRSGIVFDANCLRDIAEHLDAYTAEQKAPVLVPPALPEGSPES